MKNNNKQHKPIYRPNNVLTYQQNLIIPYQTSLAPKTITKEIIVKNPIVFQHDQLLKISTCNINNNLKITSDNSSTTKIKTRKCPVNFNALQNKYTHILNGKINPEHKTVSTKPEEEKRQKQHDDNINKITLYGNKLKISNTHEQIIKVPQYQIHKSNEYRPKQKYISNNNYNVNQKPRPFSSVVRDREIVIGENQCYNNTTVNNGKTFVDKGTSTQEIINKESVSVKNNTMEQSKCMSTINSKQARDALKTSEQFFAAVNNFFASSEKQIPSKKSIDEIVEFGKLFEKTLQKLKS